MIREKIINGKLFQIQTTFYVYRSEDRMQIPALITSDRDYFNKLKISEKRKEGRTKS